MNRKVHIIVSLLIFLATFPSLFAQLQEPRRSTKDIIRQVDHIVIPTYGGDSLYLLFKDTLQLPIVHPYNPNSKGFKSGVVCTGNVNLEVIPLKPKEDSIPPFLAKFGGIAFEPNILSTSIEELKSREIEYAGPFPYQETDSSGQKRTRWTNVGLPTLRGGFSAFLCEYNFDVNERRQGCRQELKKRKGGAIGLQQVNEIIIGMKDLDGAIARWQKVLDPLKPISRGYWRIGSGSAIRLVQAEENGIQTLILKVRSLKKAKSFLEQNEMLGAYSKDEVKIDDKKVQGLDIRLVERGM